MQIIVIIININNNQNLSIQRKQKYTLIEIINILYLDFLAKNQDLLKNPNLIKNKYG